MIAPVLADGGRFTDLLRALEGLLPDGVSAPTTAFLAAAAFSVLPSLVLIATAYPRILIVLSFLRRAIGTQDLPSNQILGGLALVLTAFVMLPVWKEIHSQAFEPYERGEVKTPEEVLARASAPLKAFMLRHTLESDLRLFVEMASPASATTSATTAAPDRSAERVEDLSFLVVFPAFVLSELKLAFQMGFLIYLPFLVIDLAVASVLLSMGMFMLPPTMVSLPLKLLVFVLVDGWNLIVTQVVQSF